LHRKRLIECCNASFLVMERIDRAAGRHLGGRKVRQSD
jgi:hypothetical protein